MTETYRGYHLHAGEPTNVGDVWLVIASLDSRPIAFTGRGATPADALANAIARLKRAIDAGGHWIETDETIRQKFQQFKGRQEAGDFIGELRTIGRNQLADELRLELEGEPPLDGNTSGFLKL